jgi:hypothetical protein
MRAHPTLAIRQDGGVLNTRIGGGLVTADGLTHLCAETAQVLDGEAPAVFLADLRRPLWAMTESQLNAFYVGQDPTIIAPAALVVTPENYAVFKRHAWAVAHLGIMRKVFTDYASAQEWCRMRALLADRRQTAP